MKKEECQACKFKDVREPSWANNIEHTQHTCLHILQKYSELQFSDYFMPTEW